jgi:hypothetical protein
VVKHSIPRGLFALGKEPRPKSSRLRMALISTLRAGRANNLLIG